MTNSQEPSDCLRRMSADLPVILTALPSDPVPLNDQSEITRVRSLA